MNLPEEIRKIVKTDEITIELTVNEYDRTGNVVKRE